MRAPADSSRVTRSAASAEAGPVLTIMTGPASSVEKRRAEGGVRRRRSNTTRVSGFVLVALGLLLFFHRDWWLNVFLHRVLEAVGLNQL